MEFMTQIPEDANKECFQIFGNVKETSMVFSHLKSFNYYMKFTRKQIYLVVENKSCPCPHHEGA